MEKINKIGHRGAKAHLAENTLESIEKAISLGVDMIEIDVHRCATGELFVIHDFTLDRTTNGSGEVAKKSSTEMQSFLIEDRFKIPTLQEVLDLIENKCLINIELKGRNTAKAVSEIIQHKVEKEHWEYGNFLVSSFQNEPVASKVAVAAEVGLGGELRSVPAGGRRAGDARRLGLTKCLLALPPDETVAREEKAIGCYHVSTVQEAVDMAIVS